jgi:hypothetical protein
LGGNRDARTCHRQAALKAKDGARTRLLSTAYDIGAFEVSLATNLMPQCLM